MTDIKFVGELTRLDVKSGDRFVLTTEQYLTPTMVAKIRSAWAEFIGGDVEALRLLILDGGINLGVIGSTEDKSD